MGPTGIVMMNLGGPADLSQVEPFLLELFADREIIPLPFQKQLGSFIAKRRVKEVQGNYSQIGGGSPILPWTETQGAGMCARLDELSPETAPHKFYVAFRYINPRSEDALLAMQRDGVKRAIAFTQYPHYSFATTGSSLNELWRASKRLGLEEEFRWSIIDRWPTHPKFIDALEHRVRLGLKQFSEADRDDVLILFSAHSLPLSILDLGDPYPFEIGATVHEVMNRLNYGYEYLVSYQSEVGPVRWIGPSTEKVVAELGDMGRKNVLIVGVAFTSDHIETLQELDIEYRELGEKHGITNYRLAPEFNDMPIFMDALAEIVHEHIASGETASKQYGLRQAMSINPADGTVLNPIAPYKQTKPAPSRKIHNK